MQGNLSVSRKYLRILPPAPTAAEIPFIHGHRRAAGSAYSLGEVDITGLLWQLGAVKRRGKIA